MNEEQSITLSKEEYDKLISRLADAEEHRKGLLVHAHNLEHLLGEQTKHSSNMEEMLAEKEKDLQKCKVRLKEIEAELYTYEQMLRDAGVELGDPS